MTIKERLLIIASIILVTFFAVEIAGNIKEVVVRKSTESGFSASMPEILAGLEKAGLEPKEAKYYRVIE